MADLQTDLLDLTRDATDMLARAFRARGQKDPSFNADAYFADLRRLIEARAKTLDDVAVLGPMGGGGANEA